MMRIPFIQHHPRFYDNLILCRKALFRTMSSEYVFFYSSFNWILRATLNTSPISDSKNNAEEPP